MTFRTVALTAALAALTFPAAADPQAAEGILWTRSYDEAQREARVRNVPILFTAHKDG